VPRFPLCGRDSTSATGLQLHPAFAPRLFLSRPPNHIRDHVSLYMARDAADPDFIAQSRGKLDKSLSAAKVRLDAYYSRPGDGGER